MQQCVYQMKFRNVYEVKKRLVQPGLVWSRTLSILLSVNGESVSLGLLTITRSTFPRSAKNWRKVRFSAALKRALGQFLLSSCQFPY